MPSVFNGHLDLADIPLPFVKSIPLIVYCSHSAVYNHKIKTIIALYLAQLISETKVLLNIYLFQSKTYLLKNRAGY